MLYKHCESRDGRYCIFEEQYGIRKNTSVSLNTFYGLYCIYTLIKTWVSYDLHLYPHCAISLLKETNETVIILCHKVSFEVSQKVKEKIVNTSTHIALCLSTA